MDAANAKREESNVTKENRIAGNALGSKSRVCTYERIGKANQTVLAVILFKNSEKPTRGPPWRD